MCPPDLGGLAQPRWSAGGNWSAIGSYWLLESQSSLEMIHRFGARFAPSLGPHEIHVACEPFRFRPREYRTGL